MSMKKKLFCLLLSLILVISLVPSAMAASLDTTDVTIHGNTVVIGAGNDEVLSELNSQGKTAKIAVPYTQAEVYVLKDNTIVVPHNWDKAGFIQFEVPGAGTYVITAGSMGTLENPDSESILVYPGGNTLTENLTLEKNTVIYANGNVIRGTGDGKTLTAEGSLRILDLNGMEEISLGAGDRITFDKDGNAFVQPSQDKTVGYGSFQMTNGQGTTNTYFLVKGEKLLISKNGRISGNNTFPPGKEEDTLPTYGLQFDEHDNTHVKGKSGSLVVRCNGLYDYYTLVTITPHGSSKAYKLAEKENGKDITVSGVKIREGSTVLTMESSYLNSLSTGSYTVTFHYADGATVAKDMKILKNTYRADHTNPKTGDPSAAAFVMMLGSVSLLAAAWPFGKKRIF